MTILILCVLAYMIGAIPTGYLVTKLVKGVDIRTCGSGNPGATNVYRTAGAVPGAVTFLLDVLKGYAPVMLAIIYLGDARSLWWIAAGLCAIAGHVWTVFLGFKGGKGVATASGVFFALMPLPTLFAFTLFAGIVFFTKYVSAGSIGAAVFLPLFAWLTDEPASLTAFAALIGLLIIIKHGKNIKRLIDGNENKFGEHK